MQQINGFSRKMILYAIFSSLMLYNFMSFLSQNVKLVLKQELSYITYRIKYCVRKAEPLVKKIE